MNLNNFTIKASEVLQQAQQLAFNAHNPTIETEHLMKALLDQEDSPVEYLLKKNNVTIPVLETKLEELIQKLPRTSGPILRRHWVVMQIMWFCVPVRY